MFKDSPSKRGDRRGDFSKRLEVDEETSDVSKETAVTEGSGYRSSSPTACEKQKMLPFEIEEPKAEV